MAAREREGPIGGQRRRDDVQRRAFSPRHAGDDLRRLGVLRRADDGHAGLDDPGFLARDERQGVAQPRGVIEVDGGEDRRGGRDGVGGVEPSAEAGFDDDDLRVLAAQPVEGEGGVYSKNVGGGVQSAVSSRRWVSPSATADFGDGATIEPDAFAEGNEVRRGVEAGAVALGAANGVEHGAGGAFAVGAGDVEDFDARGNRRPAHRADGGWFPARA